MSSEAVQIKTALQELIKFVAELKSQVEQDEKTRPLTKKKETL